MRLLKIAMLGLALATPLSVPVQAADVIAGEAAFRRLCAACHIVTAEGRRGVGPTVFGVVGRKAGAVEGFRYSSAKRDANLVWTPETLDPYLTNPREFMPGTTMAFAGIRSAEERASVIAYLLTLK